jgi:uncharacterized protein YneF (UPF0154 family)
MIIYILLSLSVGIVLGIFFERTATADAMKFLLHRNARLEAEQKQALDVMKQMESDLDFYDAALRGRQQSVEAFSRN